MSTLAHGVLLPGFPGTHVPPWLASALADGLAGVCLFAENTPDLVTTRQLTDALRAARLAPRRDRTAAADPSAARLVVAIDEEGGDVTRLQAAAGSALPGNAALGQVDDVALTTRCAARLGDILALAGIDLDLAPCLDVASEPANPVIGVRSFGADPELVLRHGRAFSAGLRSAGIACCGKHYPGHGSTRVDSHADLPRLRVSEQVLTERDEAPFLALAAELDAVMTGHLVAVVRGAEAASLSGWATRRLRAAGFLGSIVTDALGMRAITDRIGLGEACVQALAAGADLLCLDAPHQRDAEAAFVEAVAAVDAALAAGRLDPVALATSAVRNQALARRGNAAAGGADPGSGELGSVEHWPGELRPGDLGSVELRDAFAAEVDAAWAGLAAVGAEAADRAVLVRGVVGLTAPPLVIDVRGRRSDAAGRSSSAYESAVRRMWVSAEMLVPLEVTEIAEALDVAPLGHEIVVLTRAAATVSAERAALDAVLAARPEAVVVHTGVVAAAPDVRRLVCSLGDGAANAEAVVRVLAGTGGDGPAAERPAARAGDEPGGGS